MFCELEPAVGRSIRRIGPDAWKIGSSIICEKVSKIPKNALTSWRDHDMNTFCLRPTESNHEGIEDVAPICSSGTSGAVWDIGGVLCKVKSWQEGIEQEKETLDFVRKRFSGIPLPEILHAWTEPQYSRSYLLLQRGPGTTLEESWSFLSTAQRRNIAAQVADYCTILATATSDSLQTATGCGITDGLLMLPPHQDEPSWKRRTLGPLSLNDMKNHLSPIYLRDVFHYYHADLCPSNILVLNGQVSCILDWEHAAYYPRFWIATKPHFSYGFALEGEEDAWAWTKLLSFALREKGFTPDISNFQCWRKKTKIR